MTQEEGMRDPQGRTQRWVDTLQRRAEHNLRTAEAFTRAAHEQWRGFWELAEEWAEAYHLGLFSPFASAREGPKTAQEEEADRQVPARRGPGVADELRATVLRALETEDYDRLGVNEVLRSTGGLSVGELYEVRAYEREHKNRAPLVTALERRMREINAQRIERLLIARSAAERLLGGLAALPR